MTALIDAARAILRTNDRGGYTIPTAGLYPFQWNWDSALVAQGWATFDHDRAWRELERLVEGQWPNGMLPHIVFHAASDSYFPGPEVWGSRHLPPTSGITQPPVLASSIWSLLARTGEQERAAPLYEAALALHRWWSKARDPQGTGLVAILHPWESGMDNSPAWDEALARIEAAPTTAIRRRDVDNVRPDMRPAQIDYVRYIALVDLYRNQSWSAERMWRVAPFKVVDVAINAILHRADKELLHLAKRLGNAVEREEIEARLARRQVAFQHLWSEGRGMFEPLDLVGGHRIEVATSGGLLPLFAGLASDVQAARLADEIRRWATKTRFLLPSLSPLDPRFEPQRYWRGPVWAIVNRMVAEGLRAYGHEDLAERLRQDSLALLHEGGFAEYYDPHTGNGLGGGDFSWTAATALAWTLS